MQMNECVGIELDTHFGPFPARLQKGLFQVLRRWSPMREFVSGSVERRVIT